MKPNMCRFPQCDSKATGRGLCTNHYNQATRYVQAGRTTWEQLVARGLAAPLKRVHSDPKATRAVWAEVVAPRPARAASPFVSPPEA